MPGSCPVSAVQFLIMTNVEGGGVVYPMGALGGNASPPPLRAAVTLLPGPGATYGIWGLSGFIAQLDNSVTVGIVDTDSANPPDGPKVLQYMSGAGGTWSAIVTGASPAQSQAWTVIPAGTAATPMTGGTLPAYLCLAPQPGVSARYLGFSPSTPGAQGAGFAEPQNGTYLQLVAVRGAWNSQTMQDWAGLVVDDTVSPALTVEGMFAALWTQCVGTPWDAPLGASLLGWMFCYPFCNPDSSPNHSVWLSTITSEVFGTMYKPYIKEGKPGWGDGDPPMPPPPNVR